MAQSQQRDESPWRWIRRTERRYGAWLRRVADHVSAIVKWFDPGDPDALPHMQHVLERYADTLDPWARTVAARMVFEVAGRDERAWLKASKAIGRNLRQEIYDTPTGHIAQNIVNDQVELIRSLPLQEATRVQRLTLEGVSGGRRYADVVPEILRTGEVTRNRAILIARTETAKAQASIVQARAEFIGATHYVWRTSRDRDVREAHRKLEGQVCSWDDPPVAEANGNRHAPGQSPNCRPTMLR